MKNLNRIVFIIIAVISVCLMGYAIYVGAKAPESSKIAGNMALVQQFDEQGNAVMDENGRPVPVQSTDEGIEALKIVFATQYKNGDSGVLYGESLEEAKVKKEENLKVIPELEKRVAAMQADAEAAAAKVKELTEKRGNKKQIEEAQAIVDEYTKLVDELKQRKDNDIAWTENIPASEVVIANAEADGASVEALAKAINYNILWFYFLMAFAIFFVLIQSIIGLFQNKGGLAKTLVSVVVVVAVVAVAYFVAQSHGWAEGNVLYDVKGHPLGIGNDLATRTVFGAFEYMISDACIIVTYIAFIGAALAALFSALRGTFKS